MTRVYLIRHCEAMGNVKRLFQGTSDLDISELGAKQLACLTERFRGVHLDAVYASPLIRTKKTAHAVADDKGLEVILEPGLIEINGGFLEGRPFGEMFAAHPDLAEIWDNSPQDFAPEGGERMRDAYERVWTAVKKIVSENPGKTIAAATHGGITRCLLCRLYYNDINRLKDVMWCDNTAVTLIEFDEKFNANVIYMNDHSHVPDDLLPKRNRLSNFIGETK